MSTYDDLAAKKGRGTPFDGLVAVEFAADLNPCMLNPPKDYIDFLLEIGAGELGNASYMIYSGLIESVELYGEDLAGAGGVFLFGDDFQGYCTGFRGGDWKVVEVDPVSKIIEEIFPTFQDFIRNKISQIS